MPSPHPGGLKVPIIIAILLTGMLVAAEILYDPGLERDYNDDFYNHSDPNNFFPDFNTSHDVYIVDIYPEIENDTLSSGITYALSSLQGLVNRQRACILLDYEGGLYNAEHMEYWDFFFGNYTNPYDLNVTILSYIEFFDMFIDHAKGTVVFDTDNEHTINVATTLAGLNNWLSTDRKTAKWFQDRYGLEVMEDLHSGWDGSRADIYEKAFDRYYKDCNQEILFSSVPSEWGTDYLVACRGFVYCLNPGPFTTPAEKALAKKIMRETPADIPILGWFEQPTGIEENYMIQLASSSGKIFLGGFRFPNKSFFTAYHPVENLTNPVNSRYTDTNNEYPVYDPEQDSYAAPDAGNKVYIAFAVTDGDNLGFTTRKMRKEMWNCEVRGTVPISWSINPLLAEVIPPLLDFYYSTTTINDTFICGPSGSGYFNPGYCSGEQLDLWLERTSYGMEELDLRHVWLLNSFTTVETHYSEELLDNYVRSLAPDGIMLDYGDVPEGRKIWMQGTMAEGNGDREEGGDGEEEGVGDGDRNGEGAGEGEGVGDGDRNGEGAGEGEGVGDGDRNGEGDGDRNGEGAGEGEGVGDGDRNGEGDRATDEAMIIAAPVIRSMHIWGDVSNYMGKLLVECDALPSDEPIFAFSPVMSADLDLDTIPDIIDQLKEEATSLGRDFEIVSIDDLCYLMERYFIQKATEVQDNIGPLDRLLGSSLVDKMEIEYDAMRSTDSGDNTDASRHRTAYHAYQSIEYHNQAEDRSALVISLIIISIISIGVAFLIWHLDSLQTRALSKIAAITSADHDEDSSGNIQRSDPFTPIQGLKKELKTLRETAKRTLEDTHLILHFILLFTTFILFYSASLRILHANFWNYSFFGIAILIPYLIPRIVKKVNESGSKKVRNLVISCQEKAFLLYTGILAVSCIILPFHTAAYIMIPFASVHILSRVGRQLERHFITALTAAVLLSISSTRFLLNFPFLPLGMILVWFVLFAFIINTHVRNRSRTDPQMVSQGILPKSDQLIHHGQPSPTNDPTDHQEQPIPINEHIEPQDQSPSPYHQVQPIPTHERVESQDRSPSRYHQAQPIPTNDRIIHQKQSIRSEISESINDQNEVSGQASSKLSSNAGITAILFSMLVLIQDMPFNRYLSISSGYRTGYLTTASMIIPLLSMVSGYYVFRKLLAGRKTRNALPITVSMLVPVSLLLYSFPAVLDGRIAIFVIFWMLGTTVVTSIFLSWRTESVICRDINSRNWHDHTQFIRGLISYLILGLLLATIPPITYSVYILPLPTILAYVLYSLPHTIIILSCLILLLVIRQDHACNQGKSTIAEDHPSQ